MPRCRAVKAGQAMIETVIAVLIISRTFIVLFRLSRMLTGKIMLQHAAMRVARARTVGLNEFMCVKAGRVATIPVAGKRLWPEGDEFDYGEELARVPIYMGTPNGAVANGVLDYEGWRRLRIDPGNGTRSHVSLDISVFGDTANPSSLDNVRLEGKASTEANYTLYLNDQGR